MKSEEDSHERSYGRNGVKESTKGGRYGGGAGGALSGLRSHLVLVSAFWAVTVFGLFGWALWTTRQGTENLARRMARAYFNKDYVFRSWVASHGGVYVPTNERTPPNPHLKHVPERDIETPSGKSLTLMNAAYVLRQMQEEYSDLFGVKGHITGLKHFRAETAPDEWEKATLAEFETGLKEKIEFTEIGGETYLRLMRPLITEKKCLKCHGIQGHKEGDVRGGTTVSLPMKVFTESERHQIWVQVLSHGTIFLLGISVIFVGMRRLGKRESERDFAVSELEKAHEELEDRVRKRTSELARANEELQCQISQRQRAEEALKESEQLYRQLSEVTFEGIAFHDGGWIIRANDQLHKMFGYSREELEGKQSVPIVVAPESRETVMQHIESEFTKFYEAKGLRKDGSEFPVEIRARYCEFSGKRVRAVAIRDITEKKISEEALRRSEELYRSLVETTDTGYVILDRMGRVLDANAEYLRLTGNKKLADILGRSVVEWTAEHDRERNAAEIINCLETGSVRNLEIDYVNDRGQFTPIEINATVAAGRDGKKIVGLCRDITDRKKAEEQIKASLKEKEVLLREIHHRVKNNLAVVNSLLRLQSKGTRDKFHRQMFEDAQDRIRSMALAHERLCQSENLARVNMSAYVASLVDHLLLTDKGIGSGVEIDKNVESLQMGLDQAVPLGFLINELVSNALRHAYPNRERGSISITLQSLGQNRLELTVKDDGVGIPESIDLEKPRSFGLSLVKLFTQQLRGAIELKRDGGTEFRIRLIVHREDL